MAKATSLQREHLLEVRDTCLCFATQQAARCLARRFDRVFAGLGINNGQFSMLTALNGMGQPKLGELGKFFGVDHATMTAAARKLEARGFIRITLDKHDGRARRVALTAPGRKLVAKAFPVWREAHAKLLAEIPDTRGLALHSSLSKVSTLREN